MEQHFRVRNVMLSANQVALTLDPVEWLKDSETEAFVDNDGETYPESVAAEPSDRGAEPYETGGKVTELRLETGDVDNPLPGDYYTLTLEPTEHN